MCKTDKIAILLATYNGEKYIEEQINSLFAQSYTEWELFIHDDGSTDKTSEIIDIFEKEYPEKIHVLHADACGGSKENFFFLMKQIQAPYIMFCDQDDVWVPDKVEASFLQMQSVEKQAGAEAPILVFSDLSIVDSSMNLLAERMSIYQKLNPYRTCPENLMIQNVVTGCTVMINQALATLAGKPDDLGNIIMHDWWCALVATCFGKISYVDRPLVFYRQHESNSVGAKKLNSWSYIREKLRQRKEIQKSLISTQKQSALIAEIYTPPPSLLKRYGGLNTKNKSRRLIFYFKNHVFFYGWQRNIGLLIWG